MVSSHWVSPFVSFGGGGSLGKSFGPELGRSRQLMWPLRLKAGPPPALHHSLCLAPAATTHNDRSQPRSMKNFAIFEYELPIAGCFVFCALVLACAQIYQHLKHYDARNLQRPIMRILFMVPLYAVGVPCPLRPISLALPKS